MNRAISALAGLSLAAIGCGRDAAARSREAADVRVQEVSDTMSMSVPHPERFPLLTVSSQIVTDRLSGTCAVSPAVNRTVPVNALGSGRVIDVRATLGDVVQKGQLLVTIESPDLSGALADHQKAAADETLARKQLDRAKLLYEHGTIALKDLEMAEDALEKTQADLRATAGRVEMLGGSLEHPSPVIEVRSPVSGTIIEQNVTRAAGVKSLDNAPNLFTVADLSHVWVLCDVYENELPHVRVGQIARIHLSAYPQQSFTGRIGDVSQVLDPNTRTAKVRVEMDNATGVMRPGMFGVAELESSTPHSALTLPATAIVQIHDANWVFVKTGASTFRRVQVQTGNEVAPGVDEVLSGVNAGQQVVRNALALSQAVEQ